MGLGLGPVGRNIRRMRSRLYATLLSCCLVCSSAFAQAPKPPDSATAPSDKQAQPVFRAGVELVSIDVTALDGDKRQVATVEYVKSVDPLRVVGTPARVVVPDETFSSSNAKGAPRGRLIMLLIDQGNIRTGAARSSMNSAKKFVDTLTPEDRVAVIAVPGPGEMIDFTNDHDKVREALLRIVGSGDELKSRFNISITESMALYMHSNQQLADEVIARECANLQATDL